MNRVAESDSDAAFAAMLDRWRLDRIRGLSEIYRRYSRRLLEIVCVRVSGLVRRILEPADIVQSVFGRLLGVDPPKDVSREDELLSYLARAAENEIRDQYRFHTRKRRRHRVQCSVDELPDRGDGLRGAEPTPSEIAMGREAYQRFMVALASLPAPQRDAYVQARLVGCSSAEGARRLGFPSAAAFRQALARAIAKLTIATRGDPRGGSIRTRAGTTPITSRLK